MSSIWGGEKKNGEKGIKGRRQRKGVGLSGRREGGEDAVHADAEAEKLPQP